jgi:hypothetical protein
MVIISQWSSRSVRVNRKSRTTHKPSATGVLGATIVLSPAELTVVRRHARAASHEPKFAVGVRVVANDHAPISYRGRVGSGSGSDQASRNIASTTATIVRPNMRN